MKIQKLFVLLLVIVSVPVLGAWTTADEYYANVYGDVDFNNSSEWVTADEYYANVYGNVSFDAAADSEMIVAYSPDTFYANYYNPNISNESAQIANAYSPDEFYANYYGNSSIDNQPETQMFLD